MTHEEILSALDRLDKTINQKEDPKAVWKKVLTGVIGSALLAGSAGLVAWGEQTNTVENNAKQIERNRETIAEVRDSQLILQSQMSKLDSLQRRQHDKLMEVLKK